MRGDLIGHLIKVHQIEREHIPDVDFIQDPNERAAAHRDKVLEKILGKPKDKPVECDPVDSIVPEFEWQYFYDVNFNEALPLYWRAWTIKAWEIQVPYEELKIEAN